MQAYRIQKQKNGRFQPGKPSVPVPARTARTAPQLLSSSVPVSSLSCIFSASPAFPYPPCPPCPRFVAALNALTSVFGPSCGLDPVLILKICDLRRKAKAKANSQEEQLFLSLSLSHTLTVL